VRGTDFSFNYNLPTEKAGTWRFALAGTYLDSWREQRLPNQPFEERKGTYIDDSQDGPGGLPEWKGFFSTLWDLNNWSASYRINYVDSYTEISTLDLIFTGEEREHTIDSFVTHDVQGSYTFAGDLRVSLGIDNLWDEMPSRSFEAFNDGYDGHNSNLAGRFLYARVKKSWN
jgi:iron complex outermembrane receptor protein